MLKAAKNLWFEKIFAVYNRNLFKRRFASYSVGGLENFPPTNTPLIIYANHSSWWDGLAAFEISRKLRLDAFIMMEEKQLKKMPLFRRLGAFSVIRESPRQAVESLNYAAGLLKSGNRALWIFPQGAIKPNDLRPFDFYQGLARIVEKTKNCAALPVAFRYEFLGDYKPQIFAKIGAAENFADADDYHAKTLTMLFEKNLTELLDSLKKDIIKENTAGYEKIF